MHPRKPFERLGVLAAVLGMGAFFHAVAASPPNPNRNITTLGVVGTGYQVPDKPYVVLRRGDIEAVIVDNRAVDDAVLPGHRAGYHGIASLKHTRQARNLFVPSYAGLNFEHIHDGTTQERKFLFEPRMVPMELRVTGPTAAELYQAPTPFWGLESAMRYELLEDGVIEMTFECAPRRLPYRNGYLGLFWASYIDRPESLDIHFRGRTSEGPNAGAGPEHWIRGVTPRHGELATHRSIEDRREFAHDTAFPLELPFGYSRHRYGPPWYFGVCRGMAFVQMFRPEDGVRFSQSPSGGGDGCPAWDFQWFVDRPEIGKTYQLVMRAAFVPVADPGDADGARVRVRTLAEKWQPK